MKRGNFFKSLLVLIASPTLISKIDWDSKQEIKTSVGEVIIFRKTQKTIRVYPPKWAKHYKLVRTKNLCKIGQGNLIHHL